MDGVLFILTLKGFGDNESKNDHFSGFKK